MSKMSPRQADDRREARMPSSPFESSCKSVFYMHRVRYSRERLLTLAEPREFAVSASW